jgi:ABC-type glycerol-3-phosphate transport system substrate-binding protein
MIAKTNISFDFIPVPEQQALEKLHKTLDEWYTVLKTFKEKDPSGAGKPVYPYTTRNGLAGLLVFMEAYGITGYQADEQFYADKKGKVLCCALVFRKYFSGQ